MECSVNTTTKLQGVGTSIFAVMSKLANDYRAINLSQGFPDFPCDPNLIDLVAKYMHKGFNQYAPMPGIMNLREVLAYKINSLYGVKYDADKEITITAGGTQAIFTAITAFIKPGDEAIIVEPAYDCYEPAIILNGGITKHTALRYPDYTIDWDHVKTLVSPKTKMIIINSPQNPTGSLLYKEDLEMLNSIVVNTNIIVLSDEVYEHIIFDEEKHQSACLHPELRKRCLLTFSFGKVLHTTGWKMGYVVAPENLTSEFRKTHQFNVFCCNTPLQHAIAEYYNDAEHYNYLPKFYQQKRDYFLAQIKHSKFKVIPCKGTYFQLLSYENISDESDYEFAMRLTKDIGVASIPISVFYHDKLDEKVLRFCFAKKEETLKEAGERLCKL